MEPYWKDTIGWWCCGSAVWISTNFLESCFRGNLRAKDHASESILGCRPVAHSGGRSPDSRGWSRSGPRHLRSRRNALDHRDPALRLTSQPAIAGLRMRRAASTDGGGPPSSERVPLGCLRREEARSRAASKSESRPITTNAKATPPIMTMPILEMLSHR